MAKAIITDASEVTKGAAVEVKFDGIWYPGVVSKKFTGGTVEVTFPKGDKEKYTADDFATKALRFAADAKPTKPAKRGRPASKATAKAEPTKKVVKLAEHRKAKAKQAEAEEPVRRAGRPTQSKAAQAKAAAKDEARMMRAEARMMRRSA